jgi:D-alanine-D-alanine ligase
MVRIGILFGGRSSEHEVSLVSAASIMQALAPDRYEIHQIGIAKDGAWYYGGNAHEYLMNEGANLPVPAECILPPDPRIGGLLVREADGGWRPQPLDVVFPVLHGTYGEDGTIQGLLELADLPYVGSGVLGSSVGMDKVIQKVLHRQAGLKVVDFDWFTGTQYKHDAEALCSRIESNLGYPVFVKPPNLGSSVGISKAATREQLKEAIELALGYDTKVIIERAVQDAREIEVAVLGNETTFASMPGEIIPCNEFYDYDAKYVDNDSRIVIPAELPAELAERIRVMAREGFHAAGCEGMARVDFFLSRGTGELFINEVNTIPGFTSISMYAKMMEHSGIGYCSLLDRLVALALERHARYAALSRSFQSGSSWHKQA